ncbi:patatin-like phospholipase family protein [Dokdonia sinensis]|uniref:Patatin-like phospholipase family protein n=1 Tax=Dokdonia sinensis TaxID=2479847 RepID=A0A3M0GGR5_9FLAO|nr:patatin-like phospholipase family protein [Dokdonia sinensis]RMB56516.1 patatin-like phospholipase family protein [Dokdonia sinensis]
MRALVISGGGSKGAFGGGVAQYLIEELGRNYDLLIGTSTGSLLVPHLATNEIEKIKHVYTSVNQKAIFSRCPFNVKMDKWGQETIAIDHFSVLRNFMRGSKTFGESKKLKTLITDTFPKSDFEKLQASGKEVIVTVSNLSLHKTEYKSSNEETYEDFCEWIWMSCNYIPFMSLAKKNGCEYADGGFGSLVPIKEAVDRGATEIDVIVLETEVTYYNNLPSTNVFSLLSNLHGYMMDRIEKQNIAIGKYAANNTDAIINFYYTPTVLTTNSLVFNKEKMQAWWQSGFDYAKYKNVELNEIKEVDD